MRATMRALIADAFPARYLDELRALGLDVAYEPNATAEELESKARDANILVVRSTKVDRRAIEAARGLGLILRAGAGYDTIDVAAASERGIYVANCPGKNAVAVAELTFGLLLAIEESVFFAGLHGSRRTRQIVVTGNFRQTPLVRWLFVRDGGSYEGQADDSGRD
jgi:phosphoglycerate dehydrogenase-like enzyme